MSRAIRQNRGEGAGRSVVVGVALFIRSAGDHMRVHEDCGWPLARADNDFNLAVIIINRWHEAKWDEPLNRDGQKDQAAKP